MIEEVKFKEHDLNDPGLFLGTLRQLAQAGDYEEGLRLIRKRRTKEQKYIEVVNKSQLLEHLDQVDLDNIDLDGLEAKFEIEKTYHRPAPTLQDFLANTSPDIPYFVKDLIMEKARCYLVSDPKHGKSLWTMYLALCAASGKPFFGRAVKPCPVVMVDHENASPLNNWRMRAVARGLGLSESLPDLPLMPMFHEGINLVLDDPSIERLKRYIADFKPGLITVDSLIRCTRGLEENTSGDMSEVAEVIAELKRDTGQDFVFLFLHHTNRDKDKTGQDRVRGSGDIMAMVDHGFLLEKVKQKNGTETFGLSEPSPRHGQGAELSYRMAVTEAANGDMVNFIELTEGLSNDKSELDTSGVV
ncbi:MAG: AAA family ATPase [Gemmatimonadetes bacterium]|nr:AAA family ATPase [Gemmatimonadota bacterium]MYK51690.1 AAA family ATPase [Gemmatimonadota bacterium]